MNAAPTAKSSQPKASSRPQLPPMGTRGVASTPLPLSSKHTARINEALAIIARFNNEDFLRAATPTLNTLGFSSLYDWSHGKPDDLGRLLRASLDKPIVASWAAEILQGSLHLDAPSLALVMIRVSAVRFMLSFVASAHQWEGDQFARRAD